MSRPLIDVKDGRMRIRAGADYSEHPIMAVVEGGCLVIEKRTENGKHYKTVVPLETLIRLDNSHSYALEGLLTKVRVPV